MEYPELIFILFALVLVGVALNASPAIRRFIAKQEQRFRSNLVRLIGFIGIACCYVLLALQPSNGGTLAMVVIVGSFFLAPLLGWFLSRPCMPWWVRVGGAIGLAFPAMFFARIAFARTAV